MARIEVEFTLKNGDKVKTSNQQLIDQLKSLGAEYKEVGDSAEEAADAQVGANEEVIKSYKDVLAEYKSNVKELNALAIAGEQNTQRFQELQAKVAGAKDALEDNARALTANKSFGDALVGSISGIAGGFAAAQGVIGTFAGESEGLNKALLKVQSALAFAQGIEQLKDAKDSFNALGSAVKGPVVSAFNGLKGAIGATGIGLLVVGLGLLITNFDKVKEVVLNLVPGLANIGETIGNIINGITDFLGLTSETERQAEKLNSLSEKNLKARKDELEVLKARGVSEEELYKKEVDLNQKRLNFLLNTQNKLKALGKNLSDEQLKEVAELQQRLKVLDAAEAKRKDDEAKKQAEKDKENAKKAAEQREAAQQANAKRRIALIEDENKRELAAFDNSRAELRKAAKKAGEDLILFDKETAKLRAEITKQQDEERKKQAEEIRKSLNDLEEKATDETLQRRIEVYNEDFNVFAENERKKFANASEADKAKLESYLTSLRQKGEADLKYNDELKKSEEKAKLDQANINIEYNKRLAAIQNDTTLSFAEKEEKIAQLDAEYKQKALQAEIEFIQKQIEIQAQNPNNDPAKLAELNAKKLALQNQFNANQANIDAQNSESKATKFLNDNAREIDAAVQLYTKLGELSSQYFENEAQKTEEAFDKRLEANTEFYDNLISQNNEALQTELSDYSLTQEERDNISQEYALRETEIRQKQAEEAQKIEEERTKKLKEIRKQQAIIEFTVQIAQIAASTALGLAQVNANPAVNLDISQTLRAILSGVVIATGVAQLAAATAQLNQVRSLAKGGLLTGPSHAAGGIMIPGTGIEVEGGEAVINKRSTARYSSLLSAINMAEGGNALTPNFGGSMATGGILGFDSTSISQVLAEDIANNITTRAFILSSDVQSDIARTNRIRRQSRF